ncbi:MAG: aminopeptidase [Candidatus Pacearchaeota archaeon]
MRIVKIPTSPEIVKIAKILVEHSVRIKKGDYVQIHAGILARDLILEVYKQCIQKGAYPRVSIDFEGLNYLYYKYSSKEQLMHFPDIAMYEMKKTDAVIYIAAPENRYELATIPPELLTLRQKTIKKITDERLKKKWVIFDYPVEDFAKEAHMSLKEYRKFVFEACQPDWQKMTALMKKVKAAIDKGKKVRIKAKDTDISFGIKGRLGAIGNGTHNMPDGEVWTAPEENTTEGYITFTYPREYMGRMIEGIRLEFKKGKVVKASAKTNFDVLDSMLKTDEGARKLGELGIGCNFKIQRFTNNLLFDEKIGGTIHLALGNAYKECRGKNESAIHADIIKDLRPKFGGGEVWIDDKLLIKDGKFMI